MGWAVCSEAEQLCTQPESDAVRTLPWRDVMMVKALDAMGQEDAQTLVMAKTVNVMGLPI